MPVVRGSGAARRSAPAPAPAPAATGMLRVQSMLSEHRRWRQAPGPGTDPPRWEDEVMPAVTVDDILLLPRILEPYTTAAEERPWLAVTTAPSALEGEGFPVRRAFAGVDLRALDPFI